MAETLASNAVCAVSTHHHHHLVQWRRLAAMTRTLAKGMLPTIIATGHLSLAKGLKATSAEKARGDAIVPMQGR
jgi:hypothetical protein